jgi:hypothetical protein
MRKSLSFILPLLHLAHEAHIKPKPDPQPIQYTPINQATCTNEAQPSPPRPLANTPNPNLQLAHPTPASSSFIMAKASTHNTRTRTTLKKINDTAADELQMQVTIEKKK